jgi:hypothetical protein
MCTCVEYLDLQYHWPGERQNKAWKDWAIPNDTNYSKTGCGVGKNDSRYELKINKQKNTSLGYLPVRESG